MSVRLEHGDCLQVMPTLAECSIDACVTDPPYHLTSIVKRFGAENAAPAKDRDGLYRRASAGFMGKQWDGGDIAFRPETWAEVYRVLKPGAHLLAFGGTRTHHRIWCAIEDAGFEIRDTLSWLYGSGFPKSHDVSKGIDKAVGAEREIIRERYTAKRIKPGATVVREGAYGKQDVSFTACDTAPGTEEAARWQGWGTALKPAFEPICLARKPLIGTVAENVQQHGTGAINIDGCRIEGIKPQVTQGINSNPTSFAVAKKRRTSGDATEGRWPANVIHDGSEEVTTEFPDVGLSSGGRSSLVGMHKFRGQHKPEKADAPPPVFGDSGSAVRFFYTAKADADDRWGSKHPTVKPIDLIRYLVRLVTPPGGTVLDPFAGSGTTGVACLAEGFDALLIEREPEYIADIRARLDHYAGTGGHSTAVKARNDKPRGDMPLFGSAE